MTLTSVKCVIKLENDKLNVAMETPSPRRKLSNFSPPITQLLLHDKLPRIRGLRLRKEMKKNAKKETKQRICPVAIYKILKKKEKQQKKEEKLSPPNFNDRLSSEG